MVYAICGADEAIIRHETESIRRKLEADGEAESLSFDLYNDLIQDAIVAAEAVSLLGRPKCIVVSDCYFLSSDTPAAPARWEQKQDYQALSRYLKAQNPDSTLILTAVGRLYSERAFPLIGEIKEHAQVISLEKPTDSDLFEFGLRFVGERKAEIDRESLYELIRRCGGDMLLLESSLSKLLCYTDNIRLEDVRALVAPRLEDNVFSIIESLFRKNIGRALASYRELRKAGTDAMRLLPVFASQLRFFFEVSHLAAASENDMDIARKLSCKPMRVKYARRSLSGFHEQDILRMMADLGCLEDKAKFGQSDGNLLLELFIVGFRRAYAK